MTRPFSLPPNDPRRAEAFANRLNRPLFLQRSVVTPLSDTYLAGRGTFGLVATDSLGGVAPSYVASMRTQTAFSTTAFTADVARAVPFIHDNGHRISGFSFYLSATGASSETRVACYDSKDDRAGNWYPNARLWESGAISTAAGSGWANLPANLNLTPGRVYWLVTVCKATVPTIYSIPVASVDQIAGIDTTHLTVSYTYAELPTRFPTGAVQATTAPPALAVLYSNPSSTTITRTIPCFTATDAGLALSRVTILRGSDLSKTPTNRPSVNVKAVLRNGTRASTLGEFDSRNAALTQGSPFTLVEDAVALPAGSVLEAVVSQAGWPHVTVADTAIQWDLAYKGA